MTQELTVQRAEVGTFLPPEIVLENARTAAKALADVISKKAKPVIMNGEQYLEFEDWQTCGQFYGYTVKTGDAVLVEVDGVKGAKAHADLIDIKTGVYVGGAEAYCMRDEEHWNTRPKYEWQGYGENRKRVKVGDEVVPWFQLASMAQTRAGAKAFRNRLAWVVVLAGYKATPAEEMTEGTISEAVKERRTVDKSEHWCAEHNTNFFKRGKMRSFAHPVDGSTEWCYEHSQPDFSQAEKDIAELYPPDPIGKAAKERMAVPEPSLKTTPAAPESISSGIEEETDSPVLPTGIKETLKAIKWSESTARSWLGSQFRLPGEVRSKSLADVLGDCTPEQRQQFTDHIDGMAGLA